jgi:hypothetical protein
MLFSTMISVCFAPSSLARKNIPVPFRAKSPPYLGHPVPHEGRIMIVSYAGRDAVDAEVLLTKGTEADGEVVWF